MTCPAYLPIPRGGANLFRQLRMVLATGIGPARQALFGKLGGTEDTMQFRFFYAGPLKVPVQLLFRHLGEFFLGRHVQVYTTLRVV